MLPLAVSPGDPEFGPGMMSRWLPMTQYWSVSVSPALDVVVTPVPESVYVPVSVAAAELRTAVQLHPVPAVTQWIDVVPGGGAACNIWSTCAQLTVRQEAGSTVVSLPLAVTSCV